MLAEGGSGRETDDYTYCTVHVCELGKGEMLVTVTVLAGLGITHERARK